MDYANTGLADKVILSYKCLQLGPGNFQGSAYPAEPSVQPGKAEVIYAAQPFIAYFRPTTKLAAGIRNGEIPLALPGKGSLERVLSRLSADANKPGSDCTSCDCGCSDPPSPS